MPDIMRSTYFDLEEERSRGWSDSLSSSIWDAGWGSNRETDLKLEETPVAEVFSCSLSNFVSSSRHSMLYSPLVDSPRCPFQIFAIFWKYTDHKIINYLGKIVKVMLNKLPLILHDLVLGRPTPAGIVAKSVFASENLFFEAEFS